VPCGEAVAPSQATSLGVIPRKPFAFLGVACLEVTHPASDSLSGFFPNEIAGRTELIWLEEERRQCQ
jgi:hypothetical protein